LEEALDKDALFSPIILNLHNEFFTRDTIEGFGDFKVGQVIHTLKYANYLQLLAKEETVLQGVISRLIDVGRWCGMAMNVGEGGLG